MRELIEHINGSLTKIDYNTGRYITLEIQATPEADIRDFQAELRACTEGALTGSDAIGLLLWRQAVNFAALMRFLSRSPKHSINR